LKTKDKSRRRGQPPPGFSYTIDREKVLDSTITDHLRNYREDPFLKVEGGSKALSRYLR